MRYMTYSSSMNCKVFIKFLSNLIKSASYEKIFLIVDNLNVHHGILVQEWLDELTNEIELFCLPPYYPKVNPDEYLNNIMKQRFRSGIQPKDKEDLSQTVRSIIHNLQKSPDLLVKLFKHKDIHYASISAIIKYAK
jgi:transposase